MPLYEYHCEECGVRFERRQKFSDSPVRLCPECGGDVHRVIGPTGIIFKGSGFYVTDNRTKGGRVKSTASTKETETETTTKDESKNKKDSAS